MTHDRTRKPAKVNISLMSRSLQTVLANFLILRCVAMEKSPMYGKFKIQTIVLTSNTLRGIAGEVIVKKFSCNILNNARREQINPFKKLS